MTVDHRPSMERELWRLVAALSGAVSTKDIAHVVADYGPAAAGADFASFAMVDPQARRIWLTATSELVPEVARRWQDLAGSYVRKAALLNVDQGQSL